MYIFFCYDIYIFLICILCLVLKKISNPTFICKQIQTFDFIYCSRAQTVSIKRIGRVCLSVRYVLQQFLVFVGIVAKSPSSHFTRNSASYGITYKKPGYLQRVKLQNARTSFCLRQGTSSKMPGRHFSCDGYSFKIPGQHFLAKA